MAVQLDLTDGVATLAAACTEDQRSLALVHATRDSHFATARVLVNAGVNYKGAHGQSGNRAIHYAAAAGQGKLIKKMLEAGADPLVTNGAGKTPAQLAVENEHYDLLDILSPK